MKQEELHFQTLVLWFSDLLAVFIASRLSVAAFRKVPGAYAGNEWEIWFILAALFFYTIAYFWKINTSLPGKDATGISLKSIVKKCLFLLIALLLFFVKFGSSEKRLLIPLFCSVLSFVLILILRLIIRFIRDAAFRSGGLGIRTVLVTTADRLNESIELMKSDDAWQMYISAIVIASGNIEEATELAKENKRLKKVRILEPDMLEDYLLSHPVGTVIFDLYTDELRANGKLVQVVSRESVGLMLRQENDTSVFHDMRRYGRIDDTDFLLHNTRGGREKTLFFKRIVDIVFGLIGSFITLLVSFVLAPMIKLGSSGPVFDRSVYIGRDGKRYIARRFRTMYTGNQLKKMLLEKRNDIPADKHAPVRKPELTKQGRIIKKLKLANLPLSFNLLMGDISLIGVNPMTEEDFKGNERIYRKCLYSKPGIICPLGSVKPFEANPFAEASIRGDIDYAQNWSIWLDIVTLMDRIRSRYERNISRK